MSNSFENQPNAGKLVDSLRYVGYDNYDAIADIVDNSFDADAHRVDIATQGTGDNLKIVIADNGKGMGEDLLKEALKLGSLTDRDHAAELGKFGMGLVTASLSICRRLEVITRLDGGELRYGLQDIDEIVAENRFVQTHRAADLVETALFEKHCGSGSGTLVIWSRLDHLQNRNLSVFMDTLRRKLGQTFRYYLGADKKIVIQDKEAEAIDPLMRAEEGTTIVTEDDYDIPGLPGQKVRVILSVLPESKQLARDKKINIANQGFYVLRNYREIEAGTSLGLFTKHNSTNRIRIELLVSGEADEVIGVNFRKKDVKPSQALLDMLKREVMGTFDTQKKQLVRQAVEESAADIDHSPAEELIASKAKLLVTPKPVVDQNGEPKRRRKGTGRTDEVDKAVAESSKDGKSHPAKKLGIKFLHKGFTAAGPLYDADQVGKTVYVTWNTDHPFFQQMVDRRRGDKEALVSVDCLIAALAYAELKNESDDNRDLVENMKSLMSTNLKVMLS
jgi:hypothetical protein